MSAHDLLSVTQLPNGKALHRWTDPDGQEWACAAYDHGPFCRLCQRVSGTLYYCLENVMDGLFEIAGTAPDGEFQFSLTDEGNRRAEHITGDGE